MKSVYAWLCGVFAMLLSFLANATGGTLADVSSAIDLSGVGTAVVAVFTSLAGIYVLFKGARLILKAIR